MKNLKIEFKWAIIFTITMLAWMFLEKTLGWHDEKIANHYWLTLLVLPIAVFMYILALREKRRRYYNKKMTWLQGFLCGFMVSVFTAALSPAAQYLTHHYITPEYFPNIIDYSVTHELMTIESANEYFNIKNYMLQSALGALIGGTIFSAIAAIFIRRK
jgi:peptidoglycan/LPS O-acetylase OafA/YrhL